METEHHTHHPHKPRHKPAAKAKHAPKHHTAAHTVHHPHAHPRTHAHPRRKKATSHRGIWILLGVLLVLALGIAALTWSRMSKEHAQKTTKQDQINSGPYVETVKVQAAPTNKTLRLEGEAHPFLESTLYAKVSGYLTKITVDEGSIVHKGQVLATITSPETDQAYIGARSNARNLRRIANRYEILRKKNLVSPQEAETYTSQAQVAEANLQVQAQYKDYETLRAPFDGVIIDRYVDPGDLIPNASTSKSEQLALLTVADVHTLKIDAYIDQRYAPFISAGMPVQVYLSERADKRYPGVLARVSGSLERKTRMLHAEIDFENADGKIVSGSFVRVELGMQTPKFMTVPSEALLIDKGKPSVAEIVDKKKLAFHPIEIVDNDGTTLTISNGVKEGQILALNVGAELKSGDNVQVIGDDKEQAGGDKKDQGDKKEAKDEKKDQADKVENKAQTEFGGDKVKVNGDQDAKDADKPGDKPKDAN